MLFSSYTITYVPPATPTNDVSADVVVCFVRCDGVHVPPQGIVFECAEDALKDHNGDCPAVAYRELVRIADAVIAKACTEHSCV